MTVLWFIPLSISSIFLTVGNKYIAHQFPYHNISLIFQFTVTIILLWLGNYFSIFKFNTFTKKQFIKMTIPAFALALQTLTMMKALPFSNISTVIVFRFSSIGIIAYLEYFFLSTIITNKKKLYIVILLFGAFIYSQQNVSANATGYLWLTTNTVINCLSVIYTKIIVTKSNQTPDGLAFIEQILASVVLFNSMLLHGELSPSAKFPDNTIFWSVFIALGFMGTLISISYMNVYKYFSATHVLIASNFNKILSIGISWVVFNIILTAQELLGLVICIIGGLLFMFSPNESTNEYDKIPTEESDNDKEAQHESVK